MLPILVLAFQQTSVSVQVDSKSGAKVQVIAREGRDSSRVDSSRAKPIVASAEQLANAFLDQTARVLLARAS